MLKKAEMCIIAVGYNRPEAMDRLLKSLSAANYGDDEVDLLISIDRGQRQAEIAELAKSFCWKHGTKRIRAFNERQGLRSHILQCGDITADYKAVIVLEDDITVSKGFYNYAKQAVDFYGDNSKVSGISLFKHYINVGVGAFFEPQFNGYDAYLMQFAQSWGQCWTKRMWSDFREWYNNNEENVFLDETLMKQLPENIKKWGKHSWLKYYMAYIVEKDLFYVYPYHSLSTNHTEAGQHNMISSNDYQVEITDASFEYRFPEFEKAVKYDVFFERLGLEIETYLQKKIIMDLYGNKEDFSKGEILISGVRRPYKLLESWKLKYRPHEINCVLPEQGKGIYVYDLSEEDELPKENFELIRTRYDVRATHWKKLLKLGFEGLKGAFLRRINRTAKKHKKKR